MRTNLIGTNIGVVKATPDPRPAVRNQTQQYEQADNNFYYASSIAQALLKRCLKHN
jgi:hypothetical protein